MFDIKQECKDVKIAIKGGLPVCVVEIDNQYDFDVLAGLLCQSGYIMQSSNCSSFTYDKNADGKSIYGAQITTVPLYQGIFYKAPNQ